MTENSAKAHTTEYQVLVFGKVGCQKCAVLEKRLDDLLAKDEWRGFSKRKFDLGTEDGLVEFARLECLNPQRVPGFVVARKNPETDRFEPLPNPGPKAEPGKKDVCGNSRLYSWLGLQTDYSDQGRGVISPKMITAILTEAKSV